VPGSPRWCVFIPRALNQCCHGIKPSDFRYADHYKYAVAMSNKMKFDYFITITGSIDSFSNRFLRQSAVAGDPRATPTGPDMGRSGRLSKKGKAIRRFKAGVVVDVFHEKLNKALDMILGESKQKPSPLNFQVSTSRSRSSARSKASCTPSSSRYA